MTEEQTAVEYLAAQINAQQALVADLIQKQALQFVSAEEAAAADTQFTGRHAEAESGRLWFEVTQADTDGEHRAYWVTDGERRAYWVAEYREGCELVRFEMDLRDIS